MRRLPVALLLHHAMLSAALQIPPIQSLTVKLKSGHELQVYEDGRSWDSLKGFVTYRMKKQCSPAHKEYCSTEQEINLARYVTMDEEELEIAKSTPSFQLLPDAELFDEVTSDEFPLAAGSHGVVGLACAAVWLQPPLALPLLPAQS